MALDGKTTAQIRQAVVAALQASSSITDTVPSNRIFDGRSLPLPTTSLPAIAVYVHQDGGQIAGTGMGSVSSAPLLDCVTDVVCELYCTAATDAALETALDFSDTIATVLLSGGALAAAALSVQAYQATRAVDSGNAKRIGIAALRLSIRNWRAW